jgi:hypothetical protein
MIVTFSDGVRTPNRKNLDDTSFHTLVSCNNAKTRKLLETLTVSCGDTATNFTLVFTDENSVDYPIYNARPFAIGETLVEKLELPLAPDQSFRVKASNANKITVIGVTLDAITVQNDTNNYASSGRTGGQNIGWTGSK